MNKYEISIWEDYPDKTSQNIPFLNEKKLCVIGSDTMDTQIRAREPKMVENINGTHTFTFKMFYNYIDEYTGERQNNPFRALLTNERKIKVFWKDEWYDLVIKNIEENTNNNSIVYTCKDLFITELSKNGYNIELTSELQNNSGTANELTSTVLEGSGWTFDLNNSDKIYQQQEEPVYEATVVGNLTVQEVSPSTGGNAYIISNGENILVLKSSLDNIPVGANNYQTEIHLIYSSTGTFQTETNEMLVINGKEVVFQAKVTSIGLQTYTIKTIDEGGFVIVSSGEGVSTRYRANRYIKSQSTVYDSTFKRYVNIYKNQNDEPVYGFSTIEFYNPSIIVNLIANSSDFINVSGWNGPNLTWKVFPPLTIIDTLSEYSSKGYLNLTVATYFNSGMTANINYFMPSQGDIKNGNIGGFSKGEKYIFRVKAKSNINGNIGNYITDLSKFSLSIKQFDSQNYSPINDLEYFSLSNSVQNGDWLEYIYTCDLSCSSNNMNSLGIFITSKTNCWIEDIQLFKRITVLENGIEQRLEPGQISTQSFSKTIYKYYKPDNNITKPEDIVFLYNGDVEQNDIYIPNFTYEKIATIEAKGSNRFNILQSIAEQFKCWVNFIIEHDNQGHFLLDEETGLPIKKIRLVERIGKDLGWSFVYGIDLRNIKRKIISDNIATKVIVLPNNNEFGKNGFCTIARSPLNYLKETFILNLDYYVNQGLINRRELDLDLYSTSNNYIGYFYRLNKLNSQYDNNSNRLNQIDINLIKQESELEILTNQLQAEVTEKVNRESDIMQLSGTTNLTDAKIYINNHSDNQKLQGLVAVIGQLNYNINESSKKINSLKTTINQLKSNYDSLLINQQNLITTVKTLHGDFFKKYSRYIQEGTWQDENYIDDTQYYLDGLQVAYTSSRPQIQYDINIVRLNYLEDYSSKKFNVGDLCYIEDKEFFNYITNDNSPYKLKIVISEITSYFDTPEKDSIKVQNYQTQFDDLFQRIVATTQSLQYSQGQYAKAASVINQDKTLNFNLLQETFDYNTNLVLNASDQDVVWGPEGVTIKNNINSAQQLRIMSGGLFITNDGGLTWKNAIRGDGISTDLLTAGRINAGEIYIYSGNTSTFRWDENGISAYKYDQEQGIVYFNNFVRHDQYGVYGYIGEQDFIPNNIEDVEQNAAFGLTWNGFFMKAIDNSGSVIINSNDAEGNVIKCISNNDVTFSLNKNGAANFSGEVKAFSGDIGGWKIATDTSKALYYNTVDKTGISEIGIKVDYSIANGQEYFFNENSIETTLITITGLSSDEYTIDFPTISEGSIAEPPFSVKSQVNKTGSTTYTIDNQSGDVVCTFVVTVIAPNFQTIILSPLDLPIARSIADSLPKANWRLAVGDNFGVDSSGTLYAKNGHFSGDISGGTINAGEVVFQAYQADDKTKGGGFKCAIGSDGKNETYGAMMYGGTAGTKYFIATNAGVRMTASGESEIYCTPLEAHIESTNVYVNGKSFVTNTGAFTGSDRNKKHDISYNFDKYEDFYKSLKPSYFKLNDGTSDRYHIGFIAQDVESALLNNDLTTQDFAGFGILKPDNESEYQALRYEEFISLNTYMIQKLMKLIENLQQEIEALKQ